jgi:hypothetical protein
MVLPHISKLFFAEEKTLLRRPYNVQKANILLIITVNLLPQATTTSSAYLSVRRVLQHMAQPSRIALRCLHDET